MKFQLGFLKPTVPDKYNGEANAETYQKFIDQVRDYAAVAHLDRHQTIKLAGDYCTGSTYTFYETEVRLGQHNYSVSEFFQGLFD